MKRDREATTKELAAAVQLARTLLERYECTSRTDLRAAMRAACPRFRGSRERARNIADWAWAHRVAS